MICTIYVFDDNFKNFSIAGELEKFAQNKIKINWKKWSEFKKIEENSEKRIIISSDSIPINDLPESSISGSLVYITSKINQSTLFQNKEMKLLGLQRHLIEKEAVENHKTLSLSDIKGNIQATEPFIREAETVIFDFNVLRKSEVMNLAFSGHSGLFSEEATQMFRYAGMSNKVKNLIILNYNPILDNLVAQFIWYFSEGLENNIPDHPYFTNSVNEYVVNLSTIEKSISFFKSKTTGRWWVKVPDIEENKWNACSYEDYQQACNDELTNDLLEIISEL